MSDLVKSTTRYSVSTLTDDSIAAVFGWEGSSLETGTARSLAERYVNRLVSIGPELGVDGRGVTAFLADDSMPFSEIAAKLERVRALSPLRVLSGFGTSARLSELESIASIEGSRELAASLLAATAASRDRRPLGLEQYLKVAARLLRETPSLQTPHLLQNIERYLTLLLGFEVGPMNRLDEWFPLLRDVLIANREGSREAGGGGVSMRQVIDFLEENFMKEISIAGVAVSLGLTPNYLSALFHKRVGTTFTKYLTRLRMDRARELLTGSERSVGEVAAAVGYASTRHFARTFKETFGSYPSELKRSSRG
jgi:two-component system response regulator YesN